MKRLVTSLLLITFLLGVLQPRAFAEGIESDEEWTEYVVEIESDEENIEDIMERHVEAERDEEDTEQVIETENDVEAERDEKDTEQVIETENDVEAKNDEESTEHVVKTESDDEIEDNDATLSENDYVPLINIEIDIDGNVSVSLQDSDYSVVFHGHYIYITLAMELHMEDINLSLPEGFSYEINYTSSESVETESQIHTVVKVAHTWLDDIEDDTLGNIAPHVSNAPFPVHNVTSNATLVTALGGTNNRVISIQNSFNFDGLHVIDSNRHIIVATNGTNLSTNAPGSTARATLTRNSGNGRHFTVLNGATLTLSNIVLNVSNLGSSERGGVRVNSGGTLIMENASLITGGYAAENTLMGPITNNAGGGGGVRLNSATLHMRQGSTISGNSASVGGGVRADGNSTITINGATISNNSSTSNGHAGGIQIEGNTTTLTMTNGTISNNASGQRGGGVRILGGTFTMNSGTIRENSAAGHSGGGVYVTGSGNFVMNNGTIENNNAHRGGGVSITSGGTFRMENGRIHNNRNLPGNNNPITEGGGVWIGGASGNRASSLTMTGGVIENNRANLGGGIYVSEEGAFRGTAGSARNNLANDGGGLFVPHSNLNNTSIAKAFVFSGNVASNGVRIDNTLGMTLRPGIDPGTLSATGTEWSAMIDEVPRGSGNFASIMPHAFTNYDINATGPRFLRVTYEVGEGEGEVAARVGLNDFPLPRGSLVPNGTEVIFDASTTEIFDRWEIRTRENEISNFTFRGENTDNPLRYIIAQHTHVTGNFRARPRITELTVSKEVTGDFGNRDLGFEFIIFLTDSDGKPLPTGTEFNYIGNIITDSNATIPPDDKLTLDSSGSATFWLQHGQVITIEEVSLDGYVRIRETPDLNYTTSFEDSENAGISVRSNDTTLLSMTDARAFHFTNDKFVPPPMGVNISNTGAIILLAVLAIMIALIGYTINSFLFSKNTLLGVAQKDKNIIINI